MTRALHPHRGLQRRLLLAQVSASVALPAGATAGGLLAVDIAGPAAAALPLTMLVAGSGLAAVATSALTAAKGWRTSLLAAYGAAAVGALLTVTAALVSDLALLLLASALLGSGNAAAMLARYAAAAAAPAPERARALSRMLAALTIGAVVVPNLLGPAAGLAAPLGLPAATGLFVFAAAAYLLAIGLLPAQPAGTPAAVPPSVVAAPPRWRVPREAAAPLSVLAAANLAMVTVMAVVPPLLHAHGASLAQVGLVVSAHVAAMYSPAALAGWSVDRHGHRRTALSGTLLMVVAGLLCLPEAVTTRTWYAAGVLAVVGVAWSTQVVAASTWLSRAVTGAQRTRTEGLGEAGMAVAATAGGLAAAPLLALGGTPALVAAVLAVTFAVALAVWAPGR